jgi:hypothetical protein
MKGEAEEILSSIPELKIFFNGLELPAGFDGPGRLRPLQMLLVMSAPGYSGKMSFFGEMAASSRNQFSEFLRGPEFGKLMDSVSRRAAEDMVRLAAEKKASAHIAVDGALIGKTKPGSGSERPMEGAGPQWNHSSQRLEYGCNPLFLNASCRSLQLPLCFAMPPPAKPGKSADSEAAEPEKSKASQIEEAEMTKVGIAGAKAAEALKLIKEAAGRLGLEAPRAVIEGDRFFTNSIMINAARGGGAERIGAIKANRALRLDGEPKCGAGKIKDLAEARKKCGDWRKAWGFGETYYITCFEGWLTDADEKVTAAAAVPEKHWNGADAEKTHINAFACADRFLGAGEIARQGYLTLDPAQRLIDAGVISAADLGDSLEGAAGGPLDELSAQMGGGCLEPLGRILDKLEDAGEADRADAEFISRIAWPDRADSKEAPASPEDSGSAISPETSGKPENPAAAAAGPVLSEKPGGPIDPAAAPASSETAESLANQANQAAAPASSKAPENLENPTDSAAAPVSSEAPENPENPFESARGECQRKLEEIMNAKTHVGRVETILLWISAFVNASGLACAFSQSILAAALAADFAEKIAAWAEINGSLRARAWSRLASAAAGTLALAMAGEARTARLKAMEILISYAYCVRWVIMTISSLSALCRLSGYADISLKRSRNALMKCS